MVVNCFKLIVILHLYQLTQFKWHMASVGGRVWHPVGVAAGHQVGWGWGRPHTAAVLGRGMATALPKPCMVASGTPAHLWVHWGGKVMMWLLAV